MALAKRVGVSQVTISNIANGVHGPSLDVLRALVRETGITADEFLAIGAETPQSGSNAA